MRCANPIFNVLKLYTLVITCLVSSSFSDDNPNDETPITPTLLLAIDPVSREYINSLHNPLYEELLKSEFHDQEATLETTLPSLRRHRRTASRRNNNQSYITTNVTKIIFGEPIRISWKNAADDDVIALYCPSHEQNYQKFKDAVTILQAKGMGHFLEHQHHWNIPSFPIIREESCIFRLWKKRVVSSSSSVPSTTPSQYELSSQTSRILLPESQVKPTGIHLSLTSKHTQMRIQFTTGSPGTPVVAYQQAAPEDHHIGNDDDIVDNTAVMKYQTGTSDTYSALDMCHAPANETGPGKFSDPGMIHTVVLEHLEPNARYVYKVGILLFRLNIFSDSDMMSLDDITWSDGYTFVSSVNTELSSRNADPQTHIFYADQGSPTVGWDGGYLQTTSHLTRDLKSKDNNNNSVVIHVIGDLSYADGATHAWDSYLTLLQPLSTRHPIMIANGNHEYGHTHGGGPLKDPSGVSTPHGYFYDDDGSGGECGVVIAKRFAGSGNGNGVFWYSYTVGLVTTIVLSSEHDLTMGGRQWRWLEEELERTIRGTNGSSPSYNNNPQRPWLVVEMHRPMYNYKEGSSVDEYGEYLRDQLEDLFVLYNVNLFVAGHVHRYYRTCQGLYQSKCNMGGPMNVVVGTGGRRIKSNDPKRMGPCSRLRDIHEACFSLYGYGKITVYNHTALHWEFVGGQDGVVLDHVWIYRDNGE